jgi:CRISPR-associated protein Cas5t
METVALLVSVPVASFRVPRAREYFETFPCPPPATVYGMLLALVGESNRGVHEGAEVAIGMLSEPDYSVVLRTVWRVKDRKEGPGLGSNRRPDFQELLTGVQLGIWVRRGVDEKCDLPLVKRLQTAMENPAQISRFGGLSLGESTHLIDEVGPLTEEIGKGQLLLAVGDGDLSLPIWPDHVGSKTRWGQYRLVRFALDSDLPTGAWTAIKRPA